VEPPLPFSTPLLLVKPPMGLSTPEIFRALDLGRRSAADPQRLLTDMAAARRAEPRLCVNDLEQPAFDVLPALAALKWRLAEESGGRFSAVFMTGPFALSGRALTDLSVSLSHLCCKISGWLFALPVIAFSHAVMMHECASCPAKTIMFPALLCY
jgi:hypothetical protein